MTRMPVGKHLMALTKYRRLKALEAKADATVVELLANPATTPEQIAEVRAVLIPSRKRIAEIEYALRTRGVL